MGDERKEEIEVEGGWRGAGGLINKNNGVLCGPLSRLAAHNRSHHTAALVKPYQVCVSVCERPTAKSFPKSDNLPCQVNRSDFNPGITLIHLAHPASF